MMRAMRRRLAGWIYSLADLIDPRHGRQQTSIMLTNWPTAATSIIDNRIAVHDDLRRERQRAHR